MLCLNYSSQQSRKASTDNTKKNEFYSVPIKLYFWTLIFEFHVIFTCHEILFSFFKNKFIYLFGCVGSSLQQAGATLHCGAWASHCGGLSCCRARALGVQASVVVAHGLSCSAACGILPDQGSNPCHLHWQADS